ncbi:MAG: hypothetical protein ABIG93_01535 [archaeon]|nr:hypothetical protein [Nanoarchaeota archaeon]
MKKGYILLMFLILGVVMSQAVMAAPLEFLGNAFETVVGWGSLDFLGSSDGQVIGFIRILLAVLIFTIFYALSGTLGQYISKNIGITISVILALISAIAIPSGVIAAILVTYGTLMSFVILAAVLAPAIWFIIFTSTETRAMAAFKLACLGFITWIIGQINLHLSNIGVGVPSAAGGSWGNFGTWVDTLTNYAYLVLVALGIYLGYKLIVGPGGQEAKEWGLKQGGKIKEWAGKKLKSEYKRTRTRTLNQFVRDEAEMKALDKIPTSVDNAIILVNNTIDAGEIQKNHWVSAMTPHMDAVADDFDDAYKLFRQVQRRTYRQQREAKRLISELQKEKAIDAAEVRRLEALEANILKKHEESLDHLKHGIDNDLKDANVAFTKIDGRMKTRTSPLKNLGAEHVPKTTSPDIAQAQLEEMRDKLGSLIHKTNGDVSKAIKAEDEAIKLLKGFMAEIEKLW